LADRRLSIVRDRYAPAPPAAPSRPGAPLELVPPTSGRSSLSLWPRRILILFVCLWLLDAGVSVLIRYTGFQRRLTARLSAAFGRPVEVGHYSFTLWTGPALAAQSVTVAEDPRFGNEYFLRADSLTLRLRWQSLLRGQLALGTISLSQPSLNVVRNSAGDWNLAEWLPRPNLRSPGATPNSGALPFRSIRVDGGRVNFKVGDEKLPFAFVGVNGTVDAEPAGRWRMDLQATPWRVSTLTQQAGQIHVAARVGGTSSRLLPAALDATWTDTSISDVLRLTRGDDHGIRGNLAAAISARTTNGQWLVQMRAEIRQVHRWNLALRPDNPDVDFLGQLRINPATSDLELISGMLQAPGSSAHVSGRLEWEDASEGNHNHKRLLAAPHLEVSNATVDFEDALAWLRAFHGGVADRIGIQGWASVSGSFSGWPERVENLSISTSGGDLIGLGLRVPVHVGHVEMYYDPGHFSMSPVTVSLGPHKAPGAGEFRVEASYKPAPGPARPAAVRVTGGSANVDNLVTAAGALGWNLARGWAVAGPVRLDLRWQGTQQDMLALRVQPVGLIEFGGAAPGDAVGAGGAGATLRAPFLNLPIEQIRTRIDLKQGSRHVALGSAQAFGARWTGTFDWREPERQWQFDMSADHLAAGDLDRWLNPRWRQTFIDRVLPFLNSRGAAQATPEILRASGRMNIEELAVGALRLHNVQGALAVGGRHLELSDASARFYGGEIAGSLIADLPAVPSYRVALDFSNVNLAAVSGVSPQLAGLFAGSASGQVSFVARGATRPDLVSSIECNGSATVADAELRAVNLADPLAEAQASSDAPGSAFSHGVAAFSCGDRKVQFRDLSLVGRDGQIDGAGSVDFGRNLDFRLQVSQPSAPIAQAKAASVSDDSSAAASPWYQLSGTLSSPQLARLATSPRRGR
jgi:AsmA-like protein